MQDNNIVGTGIADIFHDSETQLIIVPVWFRLDNGIEYGVGLPIDNAMRFISSMTQKCAQYFEQIAAEHKEHIDA